MAVRCLGHGMKIGIAQFIKGKWKTGEQLFFSKHPDVTYCSMGAGFTWDTQDKKQISKERRVLGQKPRRCSRTLHLTLNYLMNSTL